jgi:hypothetical protein
MKTLIIAAALLAGVAPAMAQTNVSISLGQPGFYGRIDVGDFGRPQVFLAQPVIVERVRYVNEPIYLRVPPGHRKNWRKHCARYNACGQQVYFVRDDWYANSYVPRYREQHGRDERRDEDEGRGKGHGKGHGKDHDNGHGHGKRKD